MVNLQQHNVGFNFWTFDNFFLTDLADRIIQESQHFDYFKIEKTRVSRPDRIYMNDYEYPSFKEACLLFDSKVIKLMFSEITGTDFTQLATRVELCKDSAGSHLVPHYDDKAKMSTMQIYLSDSKSSTILGKVNTKAKINSGWFFVNTGKELHSLPSLVQDRTSIIVNWVSEDWRDRSVLV